MKKIFIGCLSVMAFGMIARAETMINYQNSVQTIFLREASNKDNFIKAVQTARLLAYLEFMEPENFTRFHACMAKESNWDYLSAKKREILINTCRSDGRSVSGTIVGSQVASVSPALSQKREQEFDGLQKEINDLRNLVEKLSLDIRNNHDQMIQALQNLGQGVAPAAVPTSASAPNPAQMPER